MEPLDALITQFGDTFVFGAVILIVLRWGLTKVDVMIGTLKESLERAGDALADEQKAHAAIMQALTEITSTQVRIVDTLARIERCMDERKQL